MRVSIRDIMVTITLTKIEIFKALSPNAKDLSLCNDGEREVSGET